MRLAVKIVGLMLVIAGAGMPIRATQLEGEVAKVDITLPAGWICGVLPRGRDRRRNRSEFATSGKTAVS